MLREMEKYVSKEEIDLWDTSKMIKLPWKLLMLEDSSIVEIWVN
jgi:hypothetical protein